MWPAIWLLLSRLVDADKLGGWVRAIVASLIALAIGKWPWLSSFVTPDIQAAIAVAVSGFVVGLWQAIAKSMANIPAQQVASLAALPEVNNAALARAVGPELAKSVPR